MIVAWNGGNGMETLRLPDGTVLEYEWAVKPVKRMNLRVRPDGSVYVSAGRRCSRRQVEAFVAAHAGWIAAARARLAQCVRVTLPEALQTGDTVLWLGQKLPVVVLPEEGDTQRKEGRMLVRCAGGPERAAAAYREWFTSESSRLLPGYLEREFPPFAAAGVAFPQLKLRYLHSRWGSCTAAAGRMTLNRYLCQLPEELIRFVVCHELTHLLHPDHSARFHRALAGFFPDAREAQQALRGFVLL